MLRSLPCALLALFVSLCIAPLVAQQRVTVAAKFVPATAKPGDTVVLAIEFDIEAGWHVYGKKDPEVVKLTVAEAGGLVADGEIEFPDGEPHELFGTTNYWVTGKPVLRQRFTVPKDAKPGACTLQGKIDYIVCNESSCDPPGEATFTAKLERTAGAAAEPAPAAAPAPAKAPAAVGEGSGIPAEKPGPGVIDLTRFGTAAQDQKLAVTARCVPPVARAGEAVRLVVEVAVQDGWHVYGSQETEGLPIRLELKDAAQLAGVAPAGAAVVPPGDLHDTGIGKSYWLTGKFELALPLAVAPGAAVGARSVRGIVTYSICDENMCLDPADLPFTASLAIEAGAARPEFAAGGAAGKTSPPTATPPNGPPAVAPPKAPDTSLWLLVLSCIGGGLFALAMPCTYPMIPITFSFFTKQAEQRGGKVLPLALTYGIGIVVMFVLVGVLLSSLIVDIVGHWATNAVIFASFVLFAAVLFGWINLQLPQALQRAAGNAGRLGGYLGVFFMGATLVLTSFTCTAPIVGTLLANVAQEGPLRVAVGMAVFGLTMALPFVVLALVPTKVKQMPRSGEWMETLKVSLGFVELAASLKFLSQVDIAFGWQLLPRELFLLLWTAIFVLWALFLFGILRKAGSVHDGVGNGRMAAGMLVSLLAAYFAFGALGYRLDFVMTNFVPAYSATPVVERAGPGGRQGAAQQIAHVLVKDDADAAVALAKREGKLLLYNFTGFN